MEVVKFKRNDEATARAKLEVAEARLQAVKFKKNQEDIDMARMNVVEAAKTVEAAAGQSHKKHSR